jgi:hypothetical protein
LIPVVVFPAREIEFAEERSAAMKQMILDYRGGGSEALSGVLITQSFYADQHDRGSLFCGENLHFPPNPCQPGWKKRHSHCFPFMITPSCTFWEEKWIR